MTDDEISKDAMKGALSKAFSVAIGWGIAGGIWYAVTGDAALGLSGVFAAAVATGIASYGYEKRVLKLENRLMLAEQEGNAPDSSTAPAPK